MTSDKIKYIVEAAVILVVLAGLGFILADRSANASTDADAALNPIELALALDPGYGSNEQIDPSRSDAIQQWYAIANDSDAGTAAQTFAWWRIGSLSAYNLNLEAGEEPNFPQAEDAFGKMFQAASGQLCLETINGATIYASLPGSPSVQAYRIADAYRFLATAQPAEGQGHASILHGLTGRAASTDASQQLTQQRSDAAAALDEFIEWKMAEFRATPEAAELMISLVYDLADSETITRWKRLAGLDG